MPSNTQGSTERVFKIFADLQLHKDGAMEELYQFYSASLYGQITKLIRDEDTAAEILQDVFVKIWQHVGTYDAKSGRPFTWMARIARNLAIDHLRSARSKRNAKTDTIPDYVVNSERMSDELYVDAIGLRKIVGQLDAPHQELIEYLYFREYTQSEAAKSLNIPLGTVKTRSRRALQELKKILKKEIHSVSLLFVAVGDTIVNIFKNLH